MRKPGAVALGDVAARAKTLDVACTRCDRRGQYQLERLVARLGPDFPMTDLAGELADCPRRASPSWSERCDVYFPGLAKLMSADEA
jgi:hypothetical protein